MFMFTSAIALVVILLRGDLVMEVGGEPDLPPTADAGPDQRVIGPAQVRFDGRGSTDDAGELEYLWEIESERGKVQLEGERPVLFVEHHGEYQVSLTVTDQMDQTDTDTMDLTVVTVPGEIDHVTVIGRNGWVEIAWHEPVHDGGSPVEGCIVYRGTSPDGLEPYFSDWWIRYWSWDYLTQNGITYYYAVAALNEAGMGPLSHVVNATPLAVPDSPQNLTLELVDGAVHLDWDPPLWSDGRVDVTGYQVHRGTDPDWLYDTFDVGLNTSFVDEDLEEGVTYYYAVGADSSFGGSSVTDLVNVTVGGAAVEEEADWVVGVFAMALVLGCLALMAAVIYLGTRWKG